MTRQLILASQSPRRKELLDLLQIPYSIVTSNAEEKLIRNFSPAENVKWLAEQKVRAVAEQYPDAVVLGADTIVYYDGAYLGKPKDAAEAHNMLRELSGQTHQVITGVTLTTMDRQTSFSVTTDVTFKSLTDSEIDYYVSHYRPFDKAGAYGIQEWIGHIGVTALNGSYFNVMGLPVQRIYEALRTF